MLGLKALKSQLYSILNRTFITRDDLLQSTQESHRKIAELSELTDYLLISQLNTQASLETGSLSNQQLRELFLYLVQTVRPTVFCDIGSHTGESAIQVSNLLPECLCLAFEANPNIYTRFKPQVELANSKIRFVNLAIGDVTGPVTLFAPKVSSQIFVDDQIIDTEFVEPAETGRTSLRKRNDHQAIYEEFEIQCSKLDRYLISSQVLPRDNCFALWIDVEGAADKVLAGANRTLEYTALILIEVEGIAFWQQQQPCHTIVQALIQKGFVPIARDREYYDKQFNILLVHRKFLDVTYPMLFDFKGKLGAMMLSNDLQCLKTSLAESEAVPASEEVGEAIETSNAAPERNLYRRSPIPVYIISFNNYTYVERMVKQLHQVGCVNLIIIDNASTYPQLLKYLKEIEKEVTVIYLTENQGPRYIFQNSAFYQHLPPLFCVTDPDLEFNPSLPTNFIEQLIDLTETYQVGKAGFSLDISNREAMIEDTFLIGDKNYHIWEWESQFWQEPLTETVYTAIIDTTFAVYNKAYFNPASPLDAVRIAGKFTCKHLPWYKNNALPPEEEAFYRQTNRYSYYFGGTASY